MGRNPKPRPQEVTDRDKMYLIFDAFDEFYEVKEEYKTRVFIDALEYGERLFVFEPASKKLEKVVTLTDALKHTRSHLPALARQTLNSLHSFYATHHALPKPGQLEHLLDTTPVIAARRLLNLAQRGAIIFTMRHHKSYYYRIVL